MKTSGIYRIDLGNDWFYIGSAVSLRHRKSKHRRDLERKLHNNQIMQRCWNKYGIFKFTVLEECEIDNLLIREQLLIDQYFSDLKNVNLAPIAGSSLGVVRSAEYRAKMSVSCKGRILSAETRAKMSAAKKGVPLSTEHRAKISESAKDLWSKRRSKVGV